MKHHPHHKVSITVKQVNLVLRALRRLKTEPGKHPGLNPTIRHFERAAEDLRNEVETERNLDKIGF